MFGCDVGDRSCLVCLLLETRLAELEDLSIFLTTSNYLDWQELDGSTL